MSVTATPLLLHELEISTFVMAHKEQMKFFETMWLKSHKHGQAVIVNRWGGREQLISGGKVSAKLLANGSYAYNYRAKVIKSKLDTGYERHEETLYKALADADEGEYENRISFLHDRGIVQAMRDGNFELINFFKKCGIDASDFIWLCKSDSAKSQSHEVIPVAPKIRTAAWGSW